MHVQRGRLQSVPLSFCATPHPGRLAARAPRHHNPRMSDSDALDHAIKTCLDHHDAVLLADETIHSVTYVIDGGTGELVIPCDHQAADAEELVLHVPDDGGDTANVRLLLTNLGEPDEAMQDRHMAHHGRSGEPRWIRGRVEAARTLGEVFDGDELNLANPLRSIEQRLLRTLNADRDALRRACERSTDHEWRECIAVGVDQYGISLRSGSRVQRVDLALDEDSAAEMIDRFMRHGSEGH